MNKKFIGYLEDCTKTVLGWPKWKQKILGQANPKEIIIYKGSAVGPSTGLLNLSERK